MTYNILADDRKQVVKKLEELTGQKAFYTRVPRCAYEIAGCSVEKDGTLVATNDADESLIQSLLDEGLIAQAEEASEEQEEAPAQEEPEIESETQTDADDADSVNVQISFPLSSHTTESICNLVFMLYSKGELLSKSTGGNFHVSDAMVERLKNGKFLRKEDVILEIDDGSEGDLTGLAFEDGKVTFNGFPDSEDPETIKAWTQLAAAMNRTAIRQGHIRAKKTEEPNEKFAFRTWLTRLGMNGAELKAERAVLYKNLSGHTAFRTSADEEKWKANQKAKREARKAEMENSAQ